MTGTIELIRILLLMVIQHGGDDVSCKRSTLVKKAYFCNATGVFPIPKGNMIPAAPSLVVLGENASAISVTLRVGSLSRMVTAEESPITPAPTTAMEAILLGNQVLFYSKMVTRDHVLVTLLIDWHVHGN